MFNLINTKEQLNKIIGASTTLANTPSLASDVDFVSGGGIRAAVSSQFMFNTADQNEATLIGTANIGYNDTDTALTVELQSVDAIDVDGTDQDWLGIQFRNDASGAVFNINTTNWGSGESTYTTIFAFVA